MIQGNYLYGRGAIDDKGMLIAEVAALVQLKRSNARLNRDVILLAEGDEEAGGTAGMKIVVEKYWDKIAAGFALNEGGHVISKNGKVQYIGVQATEKVSDSVDVIAKGTSGHASVPRADNPVSHLAAAIAKIAAYETPVQFNSVTRAYFGGIAPVEDDETGKWMRALETSDRGEHAAKWISSASPSWNSMLRDTIAPTMLQAGIRNNVVPSEARGVINIRLLPGNQLDPLLGKLTQLVNDPQVRFEVQPGAGRASTVLFGDFGPLQDDRANRSKAISRRAGGALHVDREQRIRSRCVCATCKPTGYCPSPSATRTSCGCTRTTSAFRWIRSARESVFSMRSLAILR